MSILAQERNTSDQSHQLSISVPLMYSSYAAQVLIGGSWEQGLDEVLSLWTLENSEDTLMDLEDVLMVCCLVQSPGVLTLQKLFPTIHIVFQSCKFVLILAQWNPQAFEMGTAFLPQKFTAGQASGI